MLFKKKVKTEDDEGQRTLSVKSCRPASDMFTMCKLFVEDVWERDRKLCEVVCVGEKQ